MSFVKSLRTVLSSTALGSIYRYYTDPRQKIQRYLSKCLALFRKEYNVYWAGINQDRSLTTMTQQFDEVMENGYSIIPDYLTPEQLEKIRAEIFGVPGYLTGKYEGELPFTNKPNDGICALGVTEKLPESYKVTIDNEELHSLARALFGEKIKLTASSALNKYNPLKKDSSSFPHWDDWRVRFKVFFYLTDVDKNHAVTIYCKGSRWGVPWRLEKDFCSVFLPTAAVGGSWLPVEELGFEKVSFVGKAGTLVIFDSLGIHAGTDLKEDNRVMLMNMYTTHIDFTHRSY